VVPRTDPLAYLGWAWMQGCLALALLLTGWLWLGLPLAARALAPVALLLGALAFALGRRVAVVSPQDPTASVEERGAAREEWLFWAVLAALVLVTLDAILLASADVMVDSDEARIWAAKAKVLFEGGGFGPEFRTAVHAQRVVWHPDYPPLNPLLQLWVYAN